MGQVLCRKANEFWSKCTGSHGKVDPEDCRTEEEKQADSERSIPATLAIFITLFWLFGCSALFLIWESEWSYLKSFYFFFISLSTIGLGDVTFSNPKFMLANFPLVLIGLSLVSMCFNVIQEKIEEFVFGLIRKFQDEYDKLSSELQESLSPEERDVILKEIWAKQPIYVRAVLPLVMSEKHHDQLVSTCTKIASIGLSNAQVQTDSCANDNQSVQTALDTVEFNQQTDSNSVMQRSIQATSVMQECDMQTSTASLLSKSIQISIPMAERDMQTSQISSQSVLNSTSMQTSLELQSAQMQTSLLCGDSSCQTDFPIEDNNKTEESGIQAGEPYWDRNNFASQTVNPATNDLIMQTSWVEDSKIDQTDKIMQTSSIAPLFYTHNSSENSVDLSDKVSQTDESYLAKAKKLEELRLRKTDSLNVMCATPSHNRLIKQKKVEK